MAVNKVAIATRITVEEAEALVAFPLGVTRADKARVLVLFALAHQDEAIDWFTAGDNHAAV